MGFGKKYVPSATASAISRGSRSATLKTPSTNTADMEEKRNKGAVKNVVGMKVADAMDIKSDRICIVVTTHSHYALNMDTDHAVSGLFRDMGYDVFTLPQATTSTFNDLYGFFNVIVENNPDSKIVFYFSGQGCTIEGAPHMTSFEDNHYQSVQYFIDKADAGMTNNGMLVVIMDMCHVVHRSGADAWRLAASGSAKSIKLPRNLNCVLCVSDPAGDGLGDHDANKGSLFTSILCEQATPGRPILETIVEVSRKAYTVRSLRPSVMFALSETVTF